MLCCSYNPISCKTDFHLKNLDWGSTLYSPHKKFQYFRRFWCGVKQMIVLFQFLVILMNLKAFSKSHTAIRTPINLIALTLFWLINHKVFNPLVQLKQVYLIFTRWHPLLWRPSIKNFSREQWIIETTNILKMIDAQLIYRHIGLGNCKRKRKQVK